MNPSAYLACRFLLFYHPLSLLHSIKSSSALLRNSVSAFGTSTSTHWQWVLATARRRLSHLQAIIMDYFSPSPDGTEDLSCRHRGLVDVRFPHRPFRHWEREREQRVAYSSKYLISTWKPQLFLPRLMLVVH
jgi:hypothetical protein